MKTHEQIAMGRTDLQLYMSTEPTAILKHQHVYEGGFLVMGLEVIFFAPSLRISEVFVLFYNDCLSPFKRVDYK